MPEKYNNKQKLVSVMIMPEGAKNWIHPGIIRKELKNAETPYESLYLVDVDIDFKDTKRLEIRGDLLFPISDLKGSEANLTPTQALETYTKHGILYMAKAICDLTEEMTEVKNLIHHK
jgi:hypothetical protein